MIILTLKLHHQHQQPSKLPTMFPSKKVVLVAITCCFTVASGGEPRFLLGGSGVNLFAGGSISGGHGGNSNSISGGSSGGSYSGNNGGWGRPSSNGGSGGRPAGNGGGGGSYSGNGGSGSNSGGNFGSGFTEATFGRYHEESNSPRPYNFSYAVRDRRSGVDFGHSERSDGDNVRGQYHVLLPDGRTQVVTYTANWRTGYKADVQYLGQARYPRSSFDSSFGWPSSGNEEPSSGNREPVRGNNGGHSHNDPSSGGGQSFSGNGRPSGNRGSRGKGQSSGYGPLAQSSGYGN